MRSFNLVFYAAKKNRIPASWSNHDQSIENMLWMFAYGLTVVFAAQPQCPGLLLLCIHYPLLAGKPYDLGAIRSPS